MTSLIAWPLSYRHFQIAIEGEEPLPEIARKNLHPSSYQFSLVGRAVHAIVASILLIPIVSRIAAIAVEFFFPPAVERIDREYRIVEGSGLISSKLRTEKRAAIKHMQAQKDNPYFPPHPKADFLKVSKEEHSFAVGNQIIRANIASAQGRRPTMEDEHLAIHSTIKVGGTEIPLHIFGVFDGHGGKGAATFARKQTLSYLQRYLEQNSVLTDEAIFNAFKMAFVDMDRSYRGTGGCTAAVALLINGDLWVANAGDSRVVLDNGNKPNQLSVDAKPNGDRFQNGLTKRGGIVTYADIPRVNGILGVARAIGDHSILGDRGVGCISPRPKIVKFPLSKISPDSRLIIACDGLWDICSSSQAVQFSQGKKDAAEQLVRAAYHAKSEDNITVMTVDIPGTAKGWFSFFD